MSNTALVDALIEAQTAYVIDELAAISPQAVHDVVDRLWAISEVTTLRACLPPALALDVVKQARSRTPASVGAGEIVEATLDVAFAGPPVAVTPSELVARDQLETVIDELLSHTDALESLLAELTSGPLVGALAARFMGRLVSEVVSANQAVADKVPGLGALVSIGTSAAAKVVSVADKQLETVLGDTAGRGANLAVRKLNAIAIDIVRDPGTREALLEIWDQVCERPISGLEGRANRDDLSRLADAVRAMVATAADTDAAANFAQRWVEAVYDRYGDLPVAELLDDFDIDRAILIDHLHALSSSAVAAALETDHVEAYVRERVRGFFTRNDVQALLTESAAR